MTDAQKEYMTVQLAVHFGREIKAIDVRVAVGV